MPEVRTHENPSHCNRKAALLLIALFAFISVLMLATAPSPAALWHGEAEQAFAANEDATAAQPTAYTQSISEHYNYRFGRINRFLPSNATTDTGEFINPRSFPTAVLRPLPSGGARRMAPVRACKLFPRSLVHQERERAHERKGTEFARHCEGCHNPTRWFQARYDQGLSSGSQVRRGWHHLFGLPFHSEGRYARHGKLCAGKPAVMVDENGKPVYGEVSDKEILAHLDRHSKAVMKDFYRSSEFCAACHKAALPKILNDYKWQRAFFLYDEWQLSSFAKESPLPFYVKDQVSKCQTCHMKPEEIQLPTMEPRMANWRRIAGSARTLSVKVLRLRCADGEDTCLSAQRSLQCGHLWN
jgi:hypothetical protein